MMLLKTMPPFYFYIAELSKVSELTFGEAYETLDQLIVAVKGTNRYLCRVQLSPSQWKYVLFDNEDLFIQHLHDYPNHTHHQVIGNDYVRQFFDLDLRSEDIVMFNQYNDNQEEFVRFFITELSKYNDTIGIPKTSLDDFIVINYSREDKISFHLYSTKTCFKTSRDQLEYCKNFKLYLYNNDDLNTSQRLGEYFDLNPYYTNRTLRLPNPFSSNKRGRIQHPKGEYSEVSTDDFCKINLSLCVDLFVINTIPDMTTDYQSCVETEVPLVTKVHEYIANKGSQYMIKSTKMKGNQWCLSLDQTNNDAICLTSDSVKHNTFGGFIKITQTTYMEEIIAFCSICKKHRVLYRKSSSNRIPQEDIIKYYTTSNLSNTLEVKKYLQTQHNVVVEDVDFRHYKYLKDYFAQVDVEQYNPDQGDLGLFVNTGFGKSTTLLGIRKVYLDNYIICIVNRVSLCNQVYDQFVKDSPEGRKDVWCYLYNEGDYNIKSNKEKTIIVQYESLGRVKQLMDLRHLQNTIVFLDEYPNLLNQVISIGTHNRGDKNLLSSNANTILNIFQYAKSIILATGTLSVEDIKVFRKYRLKTRFRALIATFIDHKKIVNWCLEKKTFFDRLDDVIINHKDGEKVGLLVACSIKNKKRFSLESIKTYIKLLNPKLRLLSITGVDVELKRRFVDPIEQGKMIDENDVILLTHSLYIGVNIYTQFDHTFFYNVPQILSEPSAVGQFIGRFRIFTSITYYSENRFPPHQFESLKEYQTLTANQLKTLGGINTLPNIVTINGSVRQALTEPWLIFIFEVKALKNCQSNRYLRESIVGLLDNGYKINILDDKPKGKNKRLTESVKIAYEEELEKILSVSDPTERESEVIKMKIQRQQELSREEQYKHIREIFRDRFGYKGDITKNLLKDFNSLKLSYNIKNIRNILTPYFEAMEGKLDEETLAFVREVESDDYAPQVMTKFYESIRSDFKVTFDLSNKQSVEDLNKTLAKLTIVQDEHLLDFIHVTTIKGMICGAYTFISKLGFKLFESYEFRGDLGDINTHIEKRVLDRGLVEYYKDLSSLTFGEDTPDKYPYLKLFRKCLEIYFVKLESKKGKKGKNLDIYQTKPMRPISLFPSKNQISVFDIQINSFFTDEFGDIRNFFSENRESTPVSI